jgi:membrane fusion protein (multidrug efflux system)
VLDPAQLVEHPLRVGLSMEVRVDVRDTSGKTLAEATRREPVAQTDVFDQISKDAEHEVRGIIAANLGRPLKPANATAEASVASAPAPAHGLSYSRTH